MMWRASGLFGFAALVVALVGLCAGSAARAQDQDAADQLSDQLTAFVSLPDQADDGRGAAGGGWPNPDRSHVSLAIGQGIVQGEFPLPDDQPDPTQAAQGPVLAPSEIRGTEPPVRRSTAMSWSFVAEDGQADLTLARPFFVGLPPEIQILPPDAEPAYDVPAERSSEPRDFQISKSFKMKAQPTGGGLGGRVTLTFTFPTGY